MSCYDEDLASRLPPGVPGSITGLDSAISSCGLLTLPSQSEQRRKGGEAQPQPEKPNSSQTERDRTSNPSRQRGIAQESHSPRRPAEVKRPVPGVRIGTRRLLLRPFFSSDACSLYAHLCSPGIQRYSLFGVGSLVEARNYIAYTIQSMKEMEWIKWFAIVAKESSTLVGGCSIICRPPHFEAEIGCWIGESEWNHGYGTEATRALIEYGFEAMRTHRIFATCRPGNIPSIRALVKSGMKKEAFLKENIMIRGKWENSVLFSLLEQDWRKARQTGQITRSTYGVPEGCS